MKYCVFKPHKVTWLSKIPAQTIMVLLSLLDWARFNPSYLFCPGCCGLERKISSNVKTKKLHFSLHMNIFKYTWDPVIYRWQNMPFSPYSIESMVMNVGCGYGPERSCPKMKLFSTSWKWKIAALMLGVGKVFGKSKTPEWLLFGDWPLLGMVWKFL